MVKYIKFILVIICFILLIYIIYNKIKNMQYQLVAEEKIASFFDNEEVIPIVNNDIEENYIGVLEIPTINLKKGFYSLNSKHNTVKENIELLKESVMPDKKGNLLLAAHSGNAWNAFFKRLNELKLHDKIYIYYNNIKYIYEINNIDLQEKNGYITILNNSQDKRLILTTCSQENKGKQLIVSAILIEG